MQTGHLLKSMIQTVIGPKMFLYRSQEDIQKFREIQQKKKEEKQSKRYELHQHKHIMKQGAMASSAVGQGKKPTSALLDEKSNGSVKSAAGMSTGSVRGTGPQLQQNNNNPEAFFEDAAPQFKCFSALTEVSGDPDFDAFFERFLQLKLQTEQFKSPIPWYPKENGNGDTEYKLMLTEVDQDKLEHRTTQMKFRIREGKGVAYYVIGVTDDGAPLGLGIQQMRESLAVLYLLAGKSNAELTIERVQRGSQGSLVEAKLREFEFRTDNLELDIKILFIGAENAGKSTLLGVLVTGQSDNGQGGSRITVERHKHAILNGYTSSINHCILGFDQQGKITNINDLQLLSQQQIL